jgi:hypothetical protein
MRRIAVAFLVVLSGSPPSAAESSLDETLKEMEMRDLLLEELDECLRVMETSACVKTYEERCADAFTSDEENIAGTAKLDEADATSPLGGTPVWRLVDYPKLSYTREAFPAATAVETGFTTGE